MLLPMLSILILYLPGSYSCVFTKSPVDFAPCICYPFFFERTTIKQHSLHTFINLPIHLQTSHLPICIIPRHLGGSISFRHMWQDLR